MRINQLQQKPIEGEWVCEDDHLHEESTPWLKISLAEYNQVDLQQLNEMTYRDLLAGVDDKYLNQKFRVSVLTGLMFYGFDGDTMNFLVHSSNYSENDIDYMVSIKFAQWDEIGQDQEMIPIDRARLILYYSDVLVNCNCSSYLYHYQYLMTQLGASIYPEDRFPKIRNDRLRGVGCKHVVKCLKSLGFYNPEIGQAVAQAFGGPTTGIQAAANRRNRLIKQEQENGVSPTE